MQQKQQYVGIDLHRRRSVIVRMSEDGQVLGVEQVVNDPVELSMAVAKGTGCRGGGLRLVLGCGLVGVERRARASRASARPAPGHASRQEVRARRDRARQPLRRGDLPEAYIAPPEQRELRELVRYRAKLTVLRTSAKAQIHAVMAKEGILPTLDDTFGRGGRSLLEQMRFEGAYALRVTSLLELLDRYVGELIVVEAELAARLGDHTGYQAIQAITGVGPIMAAIFVAEIGDVSRFPVRAASVLVGRAHTVAQRVRHEGAAGVHHQAGQPSRALDRDRGRRPLQGPHCHVRGASGVRPRVEGCRSPALHRREEHLTVNASGRSGVPLKLVSWRGHPPVERRHAEGAAVPPAAPLRHLPRAR